MGGKTQRPARRMDWGERVGPWVVLLVCVAGFAALGVLPVAQYVGNHRPGVPTEQARVVHCDVVHRPGIVCATRSDGSPIAVRWEGHLLDPRSGSHLTVFEKHGHWYARNGRALPFWAPIFLALFGLGAIGCIVTLVRRFRAAIRSR